MKICKKCGSTEFTLRGECKVCARIMAKKWYEKNKIKVLINIKEWQSKNQEKVKSYKEKYYISNIEKEKERSVRRYKENPDLFKERSKKWHSENHQKAKLLNDQWKKNNPEKCRQFSAKYSKNNPEINKIRSHNRRARKLSNGGKLSKGLEYKLIKSQNGICNYCKCDLRESGYHLDHIMPIALGGRNEDDNVQLLCPTCNWKKGAKHPKEYEKSLGLNI